MNSKFLHPIQLSACILPSATWISELKN